MEPGPPPFYTERGILLLYNGADEKLVYRPAWVLFDRKNPAKVIARAEHPFIEPKLPWELEGNVPNVIFLEGTVTERAGPRNLQLLGYYGAADKRIGAMQIRATIE
jgi:predicted GH43/DUF377 family glycosyl hydrolase